MKTATWFVTGATGFLGRHVVRELAREGRVRTIGLGRTDIVPPSGIDEFVKLDPFSLEPWEWAVRHFEPAVVLHLAGRTPPADHESMVRDNVELTRVLVSAFENVGKPVRFVHCGSAAELGDVPESLLPANESIEPQPLSDYGITKWQAARIALGAKPPVDPVVGRIFNPIGPGQPASQVFGRYARAFRAEGSERIEPWVIAGLSNRRDFIDARDAARALISLGHDGRRGQIYHIGAGVSRSVGEGLAILGNLAGCRAPIVEDKAELSRGPKDSVADIRRIVDETLWRPVVDFRTSLEDLWNDVIRQFGE
jgi:nucleoside-diphosphate-sugar epimerase